MTSHNPRDEAEGYCGMCHDWTRGETVPAGSGTLTQAQRDWGPEVHPDHYPHAGCCELPAGQHPLTPLAVQEQREWGATEPGLRQRLEFREAAYGRMEALDAPEVLLASQRQMINELRRALGEPEMEGPDD
jgi:hypothetical protein